MTGTLGKPAVVTPRTAARDVQDTISQIRQRLEALEASIATSATVNAAIKALQAQITATTTTTTPVTATSYISSVPISSFVAVGLVAPGVVAPVDPAVAGHQFGCIGVTTGLGTGGGSVAVAIAGTVIKVIGTTFTPFLPVFAGAGGSLTQTAPSVSAIIQVGVALSATLLLVAPAPTLLAGQALTSVVDDWLPVSRLGALTVWQANGILVGIRRTVDFVNGAGLTFSGTDDPANNRVIITIGVTSIGGLDISLSTICLFPDQSEEPEDEDFGFVDWQFDQPIDTNLVVNTWPDEIEEPDPEDFGFLFTPPATAPAIPDRPFAYFPDEAEEPEFEDFGTAGSFSIAGLEVAMIFCVFPDQSEEAEEEDFGFVLNARDAGSENIFVSYPDQSEEPEESPIDGSF
jgi:hypothetical protein